MVLCLEIESIDGPLSGDLVISSCQPIVVSETDGMIIIKDFSSQEKLLVCHC